MSYFKLSRVVERVVCHHRLDNWALDASRNQFIAQRLLDKFRNVEENYVQVSINSVRPDGAPLRPVELLQKLQLSFSGAQHDEPLLKGILF